MPRITPLDPQSAQGDAKQMLDQVQQKLGGTPNMLRAMAQSPATLRSYLTLSEAVGTGELGSKLREQLALAIAGANACGYCASAHAVIGKGAGVSEAEIPLNLRGESADAKTQAAITLARAIVEKRGFVADEDVTAFHAAGFGESALAEVIAVVALNTFTNYFNHISQVEIDFPKVEVGAPVGV